MQESVAFAYISLEYLPFLLIFFSMKKKRVPMDRLMMQDGIVFFFLCLDQMAETLTSLMSLIKFSLTLAEVYFNSK